MNIRMNSDEIALELSRLSNISGKSKEIALKANMESEDFARVVKAAYSPDVTYGYTPEHLEGRGNGVFSKETYEILDRLAKRELTGAAAAQTVGDHAKSLTHHSATLLRNILNKDLRAGFSAKTINKARPGFITLFECMRAHPYEQKRVYFPSYVEPKYDGVRALAFVDYNRKTFKFYTREGNELFNLDHIGNFLLTALDEAKLLNTTLIYDGELMDSSGSFNKIVGDIHKKGDEPLTNAVFYVFDLLTQTEFKEGKSKRTYTVRRHHLKRILGEPNESLPARLVTSYLVSSHEEVMQINNNILDQGGEGLIWKDPEAFYECKRSYSWLKIKEERTIDLPIVGFKPGTGKNKGKIGALTCAIPNGDSFIFVDVAGLSEKDRDQFMADYDHDVARTNYEGSTVDYRIENPGKFFGTIIEVKYQNRTPDGSLRHPRFVRRRPDKTFEDGTGD